MLQVWSRRGPLACLLWPLALLFQLLSAARRAAFRAGLCKTARLPVPLIVVGNLFVGGTGKTPMTIWLIDALRRAGRHPGVISRGYGRADAGVQRVTLQSHAAEVGDEPVVIVRRTGCPLMVGRDRVAAATALLAAYPEVDVIISDDGLQHYRLGRDIEIIVSDARGNGNGWLLPAGPLREPPGRRRDFSITNIGTPQASLDAAPPALAAPGDAAGHWPMRLDAPIAEQLRDRSQRTTLAAIAAGGPRQSILAAAGIGNPARFFASLDAAGIACDTLSLPDHHAYTAQTFADSRADLILITEKDAVKCGDIPALANDARLWVVPVTAELPAPLADLIVERLRGYPIA